MAKRIALSASAVCALLVPALLLAACASSHEVLSFFFDGVPAPGEAKPSVALKKPPRRPAYKAPEPLVKRVQVPDLPPQVDWRPRYEALPKNMAGEADWVLALNEKNITPKPGLAADAKDDEPTDINVEFIPKQQPQFKVVFSHKAHTQWLGCPACHSGLFEMQKGKAVMTMEKLNGGAYCGACHGKVAAPSLTTCQPCHKSM